MVEILRGLPALEQFVRPVADEIGNQIFRANLNLFGDEPEVREIELPSSMEFDLVSKKRELDEWVEMIVGLTAEATDPEFAEIVQPVADQYAYAAVAIDDVLNGLKSDEGNPLLFVPPFGYENEAHYPMFCLDS